MKVLYVIGQLSIGGTETQLLTLVKNLDREKYKILVVCLSRPDVLAQPLREIGCEVVVLEHEQRGRLSALYGLYQAQKRFKPEIVYSFGYAARAGILISRLFSKSKSILSIRTQPERHIVWYDKIINSFADCALTNSQKAAESLLMFGFWKPVPLQVIYNGLDLNQFDEKSVEMAEIPDAGVDQILCATGRLYDVKGLVFLLDAFVLVLGRFPNAQLWLAGDGPEKEKLQRQASRLGIDSKVKFLGYQQNIPATLKQTHVGVLASQTEGLPNAIIEYMAARLPVVATDVGGNSEVVKDGKTGTLVPFGDPQKMAEAILFFLKNPEQACAFGEAGRRRVEENFSIEQLIRETEEVFETLLAKKK